MLTISQCSLLQEVHPSVYCTTFRIYIDNTRHKKCGMKPRPCFIQTPSSGLLTPSASCQIQFRFFCLFLFLFWLWTHQIKAEGGMGLSYESPERTTPSPAPLHLPEKKQNAVKSVLKFSHTETEVNNYSFFFLVWVRWMVDTPVSSDCLRWQCDLVDVYWVVCAN